MKMANTDYYYTDVSFIHSYLFRNVVHVDCIVLHNLDVCIYCMEVKNKYIHIILIPTMFEYFQYLRTVLDHIQPK